MCCLLFDSAHRILTTKQQYGQVILLEYYLWLYASKKNLNHPHSVCIFLFWKHSNYTDYRHSSVLIIIMVNCTMVGTQNMPMLLYNFCTWLWLYSVSVSSCLLLWWLMMTHMSLHFFFYWKCQQIIFKWIHAIMMIPYMWKMHKI